MPKDSQIDKKEVRKAKANGQTTIAQDVKDNTRNAKKQSAKRNDV